MDDEPIVDVLNDIPLDTTDEMEKHVTDDIDVPLDVTDTDPKRVVKMQEMANKTRTRSNARGFINKEAQGLVSHHYGNITDRMRNFDEGFAKLNAAEKTEFWRLLSIPQWNNLRRSINSNYNDTSGIGTIQVSTNKELLKHIKEYLPYLVARMQTNSEQMIRLFEKTYPLEKDAQFDITGYRSIAACRVFAGDNLQKFRKQVDDFHDAWTNIREEDPALIKAIVEKHMLADRDRERQGDELLQYNHIFFGNDNNKNLYDLIEKHQLTVPNRLDFQSEAAQIGYIREWRNLCAESKYMSQTLINYMLDNQSPDDTPIDPNDLHPDIVRALSTEKKTTIHHNGWSGSDNYWAKTHMPLDKIKQWILTTGKEEWISSSTTDPSGAYYPLKDTLRDMACCGQFDELKELYQLCKHNSTLGNDRNSETILDIVKSGIEQRWNTS